MIGSSAFALLYLTVVQNLIKRPRWLEAAPVSLCRVSTKWRIEIPSKVSLASADQRFRGRSDSSQHVNAARHFASRHRRSRGKSSTKWLQSAKVRRREKWRQGEQASRRGIEYWMDTLFTECAGRIRSRSMSRRDSTQKREPRGDSFWGVLDGCGREKQNKKDQQRADTSHHTKTGI